MKVTVIPIEIGALGIVWVFTEYVAPTIYGGSLLKTKRCKRCGQKNIQNKAIQSKIDLYINKYIKRNILI